jgi:hypothetical protein
MITCDKRFLFARAAERGYKISEVMPCVVSQDGDMWTIDERHPAYCRPRVKPAPPPAPPAGAGTAMKGLLRMVGITASPTCKCNGRAREMDRRGIQWCRDNVDLISSWLAEEAAKRKLPYSELAGKTLISLAIRRGAKCPGAVP